MRASTVLGLTAVAGLATGAAAQCIESLEYTADPSDLAFAGFGFSVALSADGNIALAGGPGFDFAEGLVRTFERVNGVWTEGVAIAGIGNFGRGIAMNDAGDLAAVGSPFRFNPSPFIFGAGVVIVLERDEATGDWFQTDIITDPVPGGGYNFGASVDMTPDGSVLVVGRAAITGTETDPLPDAAYAVHRDGDGWGTPIALVPDVLLDTREQYGSAVAINDAGDTIAVGAPGLTNILTDGNGPGDIHIFRLLMGNWQYAETISFRDPDTNFSGFGQAMAFSGDELLATDPAAGLFSFDPEVSTDLFVFDGSDGQYGPAPDDIVPVPPSLRGNGSGGSQPARGLGLAIDLRGDRGLIAAPLENAPLVGSEAGAVYRISRKDGAWDFTSRLRSDEPQGFSRFGAAVALAGSSDEYLIGEPQRYSDAGFDSVGRLNFTGEVFRDAPFVVRPADSIVSILLEFPGVPAQFIELVARGDLDLVLPETCEIDDPITQIQLVGARFTTADEPLAITISEGVELVASGIVLELVRPSQPGAVGTNGQAIIDEARFELRAMISGNGFPPYEAVGQIDLDGFAVELGGDQQSGLTFSVPAFTLNQTIDAGLGDDNPFVSATLSLVADETDPPCNEADLASPFGLLDLADVNAFVVAFQAQQPAADLAAPIGLFDLADVLAFVVAFNAGCP